MQRYLSTARRYRLLLAVVLGVVWGAGLTAAYVEYATTYQSQATMWVLRASPELTATNLDDPSVPIIQTVASQQAELLDQLLQTQSFVHDVVARTSLNAALQSTANETRFLDDVRKHFSVQALGTNMLRVSYSAHDPKTPAEMVDAALAVRGERVVEARITATTAVTTLYRREFDVAQAQALDAQQQLDAFNAGHTGTLSPEDSQQQARLRLALDYAQARVGDLKARADGAAIAPMILELSGMEFQVVDAPREEPAPTGGMKSALLIGGVALAAGTLLAALLLFVGTLIADPVSGPADVGRLAPAKLFATVPRVPAAGLQRGDLRAALSAVAFANDAGDATE